LGPSPNAAAESPTTDSEDGPRVFEVVSKTESMSWKLEYENPELSGSFQSLASPAMMRRQRQSPLSQRRSYCCSNSADGSSKRPPVTRSLSLGSGTSPSVVRRSKRNLNSTFETVCENVSESSEASSSARGTMSCSSAVSSLGSKTEDEEEEEDTTLLRTPGARFTNFQELFLTQILNAILNRLRIDS
jgi:hypothetical protein